MEEIYFCPDFEGRKCFCVTRNEVNNYNNHKESGKFRKPNAGMLKLAIEIHKPDKVLMIGDRPEDRQAASAAGVKFQHAENWRQTYGDADF